MLFIVHAVQRQGCELVQDESSLQYVEAQLIAWDACGIEQTWLACGWTEYSLVAWFYTPGTTAVSHHSAVVTKMDTAT